MSKTLIEQKTAQIIDLKQAGQTRILCILLTITAVVSYRSVPRILELFKCRTSFVIDWVPNFTSIINWTLRLGLGMLKQVKPLAEPWIAIIDHSIDIGTKKAMVVLRVTVKALQERGSAICLSDCECIGLTVSDKVNGETIHTELDEILNRAGDPVAVVKDSDRTLAKGVRLSVKNKEKVIPSIDDIGHVMGNALKSEYEETTAYKRFTALISQGAKCLRQTDLSFLTPPKLRTKGRFQSISKLGKWGEKMLDVFVVKGRAKQGSTLERLRKVFPGLGKSRKFIEHFAISTKIVSHVMKILKNKGLDKSTYKQCHALSKALPSGSNVKKRLQEWLKSTIKRQKEVMPSLPMLVSSDMIESLFGHFKHVIERSPQADMNRSVLLIPTLCGTLDDEIITQALNQATQKDLIRWEADNIPYTVRKMRQAFFNGNDNPKSGEI